MGLAHLVLSLAITMGFLLACDNLPGGIGGTCQHIETGEVLSEVADAKNDVFPVKKMASQPTLLGAKDLCGVSVKAEIGRVNSFFIEGYVYHPDTRDPIGVGLPSKGLRTLSAYEWY